MWSCFYNGIPSQSVPISKQIVFFCPLYLNWIPCHNKLNRDPKFNLLSSSSSFFNLLVVVQKNQNVDTSPSSHLSLSLSNRTHTSSSSHLYPLLLLVWVWVCLPRGNPLALYLLEPAAFLSLSLFLSEYVSSLSAC
jgi:hypothetical protein